MKHIILAVLLSLLGPGLGQLYNKDYKKGILLIVGSLALLLMPSFWLVSQASQVLTQGNLPLTPEQIQATVMEIAQQHQHGLQWFTFAFLGVWAYAITQAYFKAREKTKNIL